MVPGDVAFHLYDTYGFPVDLTETIAAERGLAVDEAGFEQLLDEQRGARRLRRLRAQAVVGDLHKRIAGRAGRGEVPRLRASPRPSRRCRPCSSNGARSDRARKGDKVEVVSTATPFYGESGGQIGDTGSDHRGAAAGCASTTPSGRWRGWWRTWARWSRARSRSGTRASLQVDEDRRDLIRANHSATHLLQLALRERLGEHVKQAGSVVAPDYLRFDFSPLRGALRRGRARSSRRGSTTWCARNEATDVSVLKLEEARKSGAMMIFGEKYGDVVRVVRLGPSREFCGGTPRPPHRRHRLLQDRRRRSPSPPASGASRRSPGPGGRGSAAHRGRAAQGGGAPPVRPARDLAEGRADPAPGEGAGARAGGGPGQGGRGAVRRPGRAGPGRERAPRSWPRASRATARPCASWPTSCAIGWPRAWWRSVRSTAARRCCWWRSPRIWPAG